MSNVVPTQSQHPWRAVARTIFAALPLVAAMVVDIANVLDPTQSYALTGVALAATGYITKILALPSVNLFLQAYLPFLAATPKPKGDDPEPDLDEGLEEHFTPQNW